VPPGIDPALFFRWDAITAALVERYGLLSAGPLLLLPARLTRRKNVELALRVLAALRGRTGHDARLIVTGPPGPHNPTNLAYLESLLWLRAELGLQGAAHFLYESEPGLPDAVLADLYRLCDALLFPSSQEGFGIPLLEAGLTRLPVFCSDIPPLHETGNGSAHFFDPFGDPAAIAALIAAVLDRDDAYRLRRRVMAGYTWPHIVQERILPLLQPGK
jgi:glycosyltransferase involved in cell wall biosynthesis